MLILSRKVDESIRIGDDVVITITAVHGKRVSVGVVAPTDRGIHREEIWQEIQREIQRDKGRNDGN